jgi:TRAP transporter 4TM/12TM fusion protein
VKQDPHAAPVESEASRVRSLRGGWRWALALAAAATIFLCVNQQFVLRFFVGFTPLNTEYYYALVLVMLPFVFVLFPGTRGAPLTRVPWYDGALFLLTVLSSLYLMVHIRKAAALGWEFGGAPSDVVWAGYLMWALLMEALRRTGGWSLVLSILPFTLYPLFADSAWLGPLKGVQSDAAQASAYHVLSSESLLGIPLQAFAETVIGFLVFGTALMMSGAGRFFINLAFGLCGQFRGGAAKVGIFASGLLGMMSGSIVSNVLTAGTMTIPVMKRTGFTATYAAAIEACASTGAVLAPPVMGATAFVMAQFLNVGYAEVALAAAIPALLYYFGLFMQVDAYAARHGLKGLPREELPRLLDTLKEGWYYVLVVVLLIFMLLVMKRESHAPFYATALLLVLNQLFSRERWGWGTLVRFLELNGKTFAELMRAVGSRDGRDVALAIEGLRDAGKIGRDADGRYHLTASEPGRTAMVGPRGHDPNAFSASPRSSVIEMSPATISAALFGMKCWRQKAVISSRMTAFIDTSVPSSVYPYGCFGP